MVYKILHIPSAKTLVCKEQREGVIKQMFDAHEFYVIGDKYNFNKCYLVREALVEKFPFLYEDAVLCRLEHLEFIEEINEI